MQRIIPKVDVIRLNLFNSDKEYKAYKKLTAEEKISRISDAILQNIEELKIKNGNTASLKLVVWREYGISNANSKFCDIDISNKLRDKMLEITKLHSDVCIIAGTIATKKHFNNYTIKDKESIKEAYNHPLLQKMIILEKIHNLKASKTANTVGEHVKNANDLDLKKGVTIVKNTCNIIYQNKTYKHGKLFPYFETKERKNADTPENTAFRPSKSTSNPYFKIIHPETGDEVSIAIEICAEHPVGYVKELLIKNIIEKPDIHIIVSASTKMYFENICADYCIHADIRFQTPLLTNGNNPDINLALYESNILKSKFTLENKPSDARIYKLELMEYIYSIIKKYGDNNDLFSSTINNRFINLQSRLIEINKMGGGQEEFIKALEDTLDNLNTDYENVNPQSKPLEKTSSKFFSISVDEKSKTKEERKQLLIIIKKMVEFLEHSKEDNSNTNKLKY